MLDMTEQLSLYLYLEQVCDKQKPHKTFAQDLQTQQASLSMIYEAFLNMTDHLGESVLL